MEVKSNLGTIGILKCLVDSIRPLTLRIAILLQ